MEVPFYKHDIGEEEYSLLGQVLKGPILSTGDLVSEFENQFSKYLKVESVVATNSCTGALHLGLVCLGIGDGDEVIVPALTFVASSEAIVNCGAKPVFSDVLSEDGNLDPEKVREKITPKTKAIMVVHLYGKMVDMKAFRSLADEFNLKLIEDAAHCIEGERDGVRVGQLSDFAAFSFFATKNMTCGEGGAFATNNVNLAKEFRTRSLHGMTKTANDRFKEGYKDWDVVQSGWKYNLSNIQAAFLIPQLRKVQSKLEDRIRLSTLYRELLTGVKDLKIPTNGVELVHANHLFPVWIQKGTRLELMNFLRENKISTTVNYNPVHLLTFYRNTYGCSEGDFPVAERIGSTTLSLPFYPGMPDDHVHYVAKSIKSYFS